MPKRQKRVKLSKAQILENDTNKWLGKKDAAIAQLCKAMEHLEECMRRRRRQEKALLHPVQQEIADKLNTATMDHEAELAKYAKKSRKLRRKAEQVTDVPVTELPIADTLPGDRAARLEAMGFRKIGKRKAQPAVTGQS